MNDLWQLLTLFGSSFVVGLSGAMMPGPMLTATISESLKKGAWSGPAVVTGHGLVEVPTLLALVFGLGPLLNKPAVFTAIAVLGGVMLLLMGGHMMMGSRKAAETIEHTEGDRTILRGPVAAGALTSLSNPYFFVWWATIGLSFTSKSLAWGALGVTIFYTGHILSDLAWFGFVSTAVSHGRRICPPRIIRGILIACGVVLLIIGVAFIRAGL